MRLTKNKAATVFVMSLVYLFLVAPLFQTIGCSSGEKAGLSEEPLLNEPQDGGVDNPSGQEPPDAGNLAGDQDTAGNGDEDGDSGTDDDAGGNTDEGDSNGGGGEVGDGGGDEEVGEDTGDEGDTENTEEAWGTTYYVRPGGGTSEQCSGLVDADYAGSGADQPCAFSHPFFALPPIDGTVKLAPGDRLIIAAGEYKMGKWATGAARCEREFGADCIMAAMPSGPDRDHPTRIYGAGWNNGCTSPPELFGVERPYYMIDLAGKNNITLNCMEITDHSDCVEFHTGGHACNRDNAPFGDWAPVGIVASDSENVRLKNLNIHGLANRGVYAGRITDWTIEDVRIAGNGWAGWDGDISGADSNSGTITFRRVSIEWNGCAETYPGGSPAGCWGQSAGGYGDGLGTGSTGGNWIFEDSEFLHNTSDGLDLLYHDGAGEIIINRVHSEGNAGNQLKTRGATAITNSVIVSNCGYFEGKPFTYNVDSCRSYGNALALAMDSGTQSSMVNTTIYGEGDCLIEATAAEAPGCTGARLESLNNIFLGGTDFLQPFESSCLIWSDCGVEFDNDYSVIYGVKNSVCPTGINDLCADPLLGPLTGDSYGMIPADGSPAIDSGISTGGLIPILDIRGYLRPYGGGTDRGAYEAGSSPP